MSGPRQVDLALDVDGDLAISPDGSLTLTEDLAQAVASSLRLFEGEFFLDRSVGMPWLQRILTAGASIGHIRSAFRAGILGTPGVRSLEMLTLRLDRAARALTVEFRANGEPATVTLTVP